MIEIDGSYLEGGGQILRTAISLSAITGKPCRIFNIRKGRKKTGLMAQHLLGIQNVAKLCNGYLESDRLNSPEIKFYPKEITAKDLHIRIETAGSIVLCLQSLLPVALFAPAPIKIFFHGGGSDVPFSPTIDYFRYIFLKILEKMLALLNSEGIFSGGGKVEINILKRGYYPEGGARIEVKVFPQKKDTHYHNHGRINEYPLKSLNLRERGALKKILSISGASEFLKSKKVAERQLFGVREVLGKLKLPIEEKVEYYQTNCPGSQICLIADFENTVIGTDNLGKLGKRAEDVGKEAALELLKEQKSEACLDKHLADQILPYLALVKNKSEVTVSEITEHCKTNIWVIEKFIAGKPSTKAKLGAGLVPHRNKVSGAGFEIKDNLIRWTPS